MIRFFGDANRYMLCEAVGEVEGESLCSPLLGGRSVVGGAKAGGCTVGLEPIAVGQVQDFGGAVSGSRVGDEGRMVGEVSGVGPGWGFRGRDEGVGRVKEVVEEVTETAEVVDGERKKEDAFRVEFSDDIRIGSDEFRSSACLVCLS